MWLTKSFLCLLGILQWTLFAAAGVREDGIIDNLKRVMEGWRADTCSLCLQAITDRSADLGLVAAKTTLLKNEIAKLEEFTSDHMLICTVLARVQMDIRFREELESMKQNIFATSARNAIRKNFNWRMQRNIIKEIELFIENQHCTENDEPWPAGDPAPKPPVDNSGTQRQTKGTSQRGKDAGTGPQQLEDENGSEGGKNGQSIWMPTGDVGRRGASLDSANSLQDNLRSGIVYMQSVAAEYFPLPFGDRGGDRGRGGVEGMGLIPGAGRGGRLVLRPGPRR